MALYLRSFACRLPTSTSCVSKVIFATPQIEFTPVPKTTQMKTSSASILPLLYKSYISQQKADCEDLSVRISKLADKTQSLDVDYFSKCMPFISSPAVVTFQELSRLHAVQQPQAKSTDRSEPPVQSQSHKLPQSDGKPSPEQLDRVASILETSLNRFFYQSFNYRVISPNIVLEDYIRGKVYKGLSSYTQQILLVRFVGHLKFAFVEVELLSLAKFPQEGRITIRWRIKGISGLRVFLKFWKYQLWNYKRIMNQSATWIDGISHYDVGADGLVYRHIVEQIEHDKETSSDAKKAKKLRLLSKLPGSASA